jgi:DNA-binding MarR family transcriptional regulator
MARGDTEELPSMRRPRFLYLLSVAHRRVQNAFQSEVDGATGTRAGLLMALQANGNGTPMRQLGLQLDLGAPALTGLVERMARDGLIERRADSADGRAWNIVLTDAGKTSRIEATRWARLLNDRLCEGFDTAELATVARWLEAVNTKFQRRD